MNTIWPEWKVIEQLGEGSFGSVYKVIRVEHDITSTAAVKVISIPRSDAELSSLRMEGLSEIEIRSYYESTVTSIVNEIKLMESMKGTSNIVSIEDFKVIEKNDRIGWDIFVRMELLTSLNDYISDKKMSENEIIKLGQDICSALELCARRNIIHRDIKPENIFISSFGDFKIGDFGFARKLEKANDSLTRKGSPNYIAPEIYTSKDYDATVDIYSLGLVLYKLLNNNRFPFLDPNAQLIQYQDRKLAIDRRLRGDALPSPINASPEMAKVILTACAYKSSERFQSPIDFKIALGNIREITSENLFFTPSQSSALPATQSHKSFLKSKKTILIVACTVVVIVIFCFTAWLFFRDDTPFPVNAGKATTLAAGSTNSFYVKNDGSLWAWGYNADGQLGYGTRTSHHTPVNIMDDVTVVSTSRNSHDWIGQSHTLTIKTDGSLWAWGYNNYGQLGDNTTAFRYIPIKIIEDVISVSAGWYHSTAIKKDGSLWAWGSNYYGVLGDGAATVTSFNLWADEIIDNNDKHVPIKIMDDVVAVSAGRYHTMAIRTDSSLWVWGSNANGKLGDGTVSLYDTLNGEFIENNDKNTPVKIMDDIVNVSAGDYHSMAIGSDGCLWAWGGNFYGLLGDGTVTIIDPWTQDIIESNDKYVPIMIMDNVITVATGGLHTAAIRTDGSLWTWGLNNSGQLGDGTVIDRYTPIRIMEDVMAVSVGDYHTMALKSDGSIWTWGSNRYGQLGDGTTIMRLQPVQVIDDAMLLD